MPTKSVVDAPVAAQPVVSGSSLTFKFIKSTSFIVDGISHTAYVIAHKGRAMNVSTLSLVDSGVTLSLDATARTLKITGKIAVVQKPYVDLSTGTTLVGLSIMPKFDLDIDAF